MGQSSHSRGSVAAFPLEPKLELCSTPLHMNGRRQWPQHTLEYNTAETKSTTAPMSSVRASHHGAWSKEQPVIYIKFRNRQNHLWWSGKGFARKEGLERGTKGLGGPLLFYPFDTFIL